MLWQTSAEAAYLRWQAAITDGQESGQAPLLELGQNYTPLEHLWSVHALQHWLQQRKDVTTPEITLGGESALWLYLFFQSRTERTAPLVREPVFIFTGVEPTIQMAARMSFVPPGYTAAHTPYEQNGALLASVSPFFAPVLEPGHSTTWDALPFVMEPIARFQHFAQPADVSTDWTAWAALLLAIALLFAPLLGR